MGAEKTTGTTGDLRGTAPKPATKDQGKDQRPETKDQEWGNKDQELRTRELGPGSREWELRSKDQGTLITRNEGRAKHAPNF